LFAEFDVVLDFVCGFLVDDGGKVGGGVFGVAEDERIGGFDEAGEE